MDNFKTKILPVEADVIAPDGSNVRLLLGLKGGAMAQFELPAGKVSHAVVHSTVEEIWYVVSGSGEMWRNLNDREEIVALHPGLCLTLPLHTRFQFKAAAHEAVIAVGVTMPPWPGDEEAQLISGPWMPSID